MSPHNPDCNQFLKVLRREQPDYVPFYEHLADRSIMEAMVGRPFPHNRPGMENKKKVMQFYVDFYLGNRFDCLPFETGLHLFKMGSQDANGRGWANHDVATISNIEEFEEYPWPDIDHAIDFDLIEAAGKVLPDGMELVCGVAGGVQEYVLGLVGMKRMSVALRKDQKFISAMFRKIGDLIQGVDKIIAEYDFVCALRMGDDMGYKTGLLLGPKVVCEFVLPEHKRIVQTAHSAGKPFILHSCGNLSEIIDTWIDEVKMDAWHSFQDVILPVTEAKKQYSTRVALLGGVDLDVLCRSNPTELDVYCKRVLDTCKKGGGYAFGTGNSVADYIPVEQYRLMLEFGKKYGSY